MHKIPFLSLETQHLQIKDKVDEALLKSYASNYYILGPRLNEFEKAYAFYSDVNYCIGVGNGLDALKISLKSLGIESGDEVIVPSHTFIATILAIMEVGAKPILVDTDSNTFNLNINEIEDKITSKTKCIIAVHMYGSPCSMDQLLNICSQHKLYLIEDNAQAHGSLYKGKKTGSFGIINATSFYPAKNLGALGDGGGITTNDKLLKEKVEKIRNYGSSDKYISDVDGCNSRLDEIQAAVLSIKLEYLDQWNKERNDLASLYKKYLDLNSIKLQFVDTENYSSFHLFVIQVKKRDQLKEWLAQHQIETLIHYPIPTHLQKACKSLGYKKGDFPVTELLSKSLLSLPLYIGLTEENIKFICLKINEFHNKKGL